MLLNQEHKIGHPIDAPWRATDMLWNPQHMGKALACMFGMSNVYVFVKNYINLKMFFSPVWLYRSILFGLVFSKRFPTVYKHGMI